MALDAVRASANLMPLLVPRRFLWSVRQLTLASWANVTHAKLSFKTQSRVVLRDPQNNPSCSTSVCLLLPRWNESSF